MKNKRVIMIFFLIFITSILYGFLFSIKKGNPYIYNSDYLLYVVSGRDIFSGNIELSEWYGSTNTFYGLALLYGVVGCFYGYSANLLVIVSAILFSVVSVCLCYIVWSTCKSNRLVKTLFAYALLIAGFGNYSKGIYAGTHIDVSVLSITYFYIISRGDVKSIKWKLAFLVISVFMFVGFLSDSLLIVYSIIPVGMVIVSLLIKKCYINIKTKLMFFLILLIEFGAARFVINNWNGITLSHKMVISTTGADELFARIMATIETMLYMFGGDVFKQNIEIANIGILLVCVISIYAVVSYIKQMDTILNDDLYYYCISSILVSAALMTFTTYNKLPEVPHNSIRMLYNAFFCMIILLCSINIDKLKILRCIDNKKIILVCIVFLLFHGITRIDYKEKIVTNNKYKQSVEYLNDKNFNKGFCSYWTSYPIMVESNYKIDTTAIIGTNPAFFDWNTKYPSLEEPSYFLIVEDTGFAGLDYETICKSIGEPLEHAKFEDINVYSWKYDITPYIRGLKKDKGIYMARGYKYTKDVTEFNDGVIMHPGTIAFGPFEKLSAGKYKLTCEGDSLHAASIDVHSNTKQNDIIYTELSNSENVKEVLFDLKGDVDDIEYRLFNESGEDVIYKKMVIEKVAESI